jgi:tetratricopeptide (TPR) repeat protein
VRVSTGVVLVALAGCGGAQRGPDDPLVDAPAREQVRVLAAVEWTTLVARGTQLVEAGDLVRAEQYLAVALRRGAPPERVLPTLLHVCIAGQRYRAAAEYARPYLEQHADAWALHYLVATIHIGLGEPQAARRHLELVVQHNPGYAEAHFVLAKILRDDLRDPADADVHFRRYLDLEPNGVYADEAHAGQLTRVRP